jgi:SAM-dependent methyltransferase
MPEPDDKMTGSVKTDTAHLDWDTRWKTEQGRSDWVTPEAFVVETIPLLKLRGVATVLDLGCGVGRHAFTLARAGFRVYAVDASPAAIDHVFCQAKEQGIDISTYIGEMTHVPLENETIDYVLAWNVIYHGDLSIVQQTLSEISRVLKPGGLFQGTMLSKRNSEMATGRRIARDTYVNIGRFEKRHPHFYCNAADLVAILNGFEPLILKDLEHRRPGSFHWRFLAEKIASHNLPSCGR